MASISLSAAKAASASAGSPDAQDLAHPLEVLVDAHAHELDLEAQLVELLAEPVPQRLDRLGGHAQPKRPVT